MNHSCASQAPECASLVNRGYPQGWPFNHPDVLMHSGGSVGGTTMLVLCRSHQRAAAVVKNVDRDTTADLLLISMKLLDHFESSTALLEK